MEATGSASIAAATAPAAPDRDRTSGRVGPNAVLQLVAALRAGGYDKLLDQLFAEAHCPELLYNPPSIMVHEGCVARLYHALYASLPHDLACHIASDAGRRTADYIIANRIPKFARCMLTRLPPPLAAPLLASAITKNAWTFAGSGRFSVRYRPSLRFAIAANPLAVPATCCNGGEPAPGCHWHVGVFTQLFRTLVGHDARVREIACCGCGDDACQFDVAL